MVAEQSFQTPSKTVEKKYPTPSTAASSDEESPSLTVPNDPSKRSRQNASYYIFSPENRKKTRSGATPKKLSPKKLSSKSFSPWRQMGSRYSRAGDVVESPLKGAKNLQADDVIELPSPAKSMQADNVVEMLDVAAGSTSMTGNGCGGSSSDSLSDSDPHIVPQSSLRRTVKAAFRNVFVPSKKGKKVTVQWKESSEPSKEESAVTKSRRNKSFMEKVASEVKLDIATLQKRLNDWCSSDVRVKEVVQSVAAVVAVDSDAEDITKNLKAFVQHLSQGFNGSGGGTRTKREQEALITALVASNWLSPLPPTRIENLFGVTFRFARKVTEMAKSGTYLSERKTRKDSLLPLLLPFVDKWSHDDSVTRVDNGGKTSRNFVTLYDSFGKKQEHRRRIWQWKTMSEKYSMFLASDYYKAYVQELMSNEYFAKRYSQDVSSKEQKLRQALGRASDIKLSVEDLTKGLQARRVMTKECATWDTLVSILYNYEFGDLVLGEDEGEGEEDGITTCLGIRNFEKCLCRCVHEPKMESCVDTMLNQVTLWARSLANSCKHNKAIKEEFQHCQCPVCTIISSVIRGDRDSVTTGITAFNNLLRSNANVYRLVDYTCCERVPFPEFKTERDVSIPRLIPRKCTDPTMTCELCGVDVKFAGARNCPVWIGCTQLVETLEYKPTPRSGEHNGEQRTQVELTAVTLQLRQLFIKFLDKLRDARRHLNNTSWTNRKILNTDNSVSDVRLASHIDYAATMNLHPIFKKNCHENAHVANLVIILHWKPRTVVVPMPDGSFKQHFVRENWAIHSFFDTISRGKKTDAIGIRYSLVEDFVILFKEVLARNPGWILGIDSFLDVFTITSDNCKNQNKCAKAFWLMGTLCRDLAPRLAVLYLKHEKKRNVNAGVSVKKWLAKPFGIEELRGDSLGEFNEKVASEMNWAETAPWPVTVKETDPFISVFEATPSQEFAALSQEGDDGITEEAFISGDTDFEEWSGSGSSTFCDGLSQDDNSSDITSDFLDCLDPDSMEYMVGATTVEEINERFGKRVPSNWVELLSFHIRQQYSEPDQGRGQHDGEGGTVKTRCYNGELSGNRSADATGVFETMTECCGKKTGVKETLPLEEYIRQGDRRLLKVTPGAISHRVYQVFLEDHEDVRRLRESGYQHVHYIERKNPMEDYTKTVKGSERFKEVWFPRNQPEAEEVVMWSSTLACACSLCSIQFDHQDCKYKHLRKVDRHALQKRSSSNRSELPDAQTSKRRADPPQVKEALRRLCQKYDRSRFLKDDLVDFIVNHFSLPRPPTWGEESLKQNLVKTVFEAAFPGEILNLDSSQSAPETSEELEEECDATDDDGFYFNDDEIEPDLYADALVHGGSGSQLLELGCTSLENFGNMCYLNSLLQMLSSSQQILNLVGHLWLDQEASAQPLLLSEVSKWVATLNYLHGHHCLSLRNLLRLFHHCYSMSGNDRKNYQLGVQHDPSEFLRSLLDCICYQSDSTFAGFQNLFCVTLNEANQNGGQVHEISETCLQASIPTGTTQEVNLREAIERCLSNLNAEVTKWPTILIVAVDRSVNTAGFVSDAKVAFQESLTFMGSPDYKLRGIINRSGIHASAGHYTAHVKRASSSSLNEDDNRSSPAWIFCNDSEVLFVGADEVFGVQSQRTVRMLLFEVGLLQQEEMRDFSSVANENITQMMDFYRDQLVYADKELQSMDLRGLSKEALELQLTARNIPNISIPSAPIESLASQLSNFLSDNP